MVRHVPGEHADRAAAAEQPGAEHGGGGSEPGAEPPPSAAGAAATSPSRGGSFVLAITGGTGFVGDHLLRHALEAGHQVRALTRRAQAPRDGLTWIEGALDRPETLTTLCDGADAVIHVAGLLTGDRAALEAVNVAGTENLIAAAREAGISRFVHISSLAAREPELSSYGWSKARSEEVVAAAALAATIIRPPAVYGPGDRETLDLFRMAKRGFVALPPPGHFSVIHVDDLCRLILSVAADPATVGETYEPDDGRTGGWDHRDFARALGAAFDRRAATFSTPRPLMQAVSRLDTLLRGGKAKLTADRVRYFCHPDWVVTARHRPPASLWGPRIDTPQGLRDTARWYAGAGWLG